jgi:hypothetical protein
MRDLKKGRASLKARLAVPPGIWNCLSFLMESLSSGEQHRRHCVEGFTRIEINQ